MHVNKNNTKCIYAHGGVCISTDGYVKPCCHFKSDFKGIGVKKRPHWTKNHRETDEWKSLIDNLDNGIRDERCSKCWDLEDAGNESMRLSSNHDQQNNSITKTPWSYVDLKLGTKCNLMCNMCSGTSSSLLAKEQWDNKNEDWLSQGPSANNKKNITKEKAWNEYKGAGYTNILQWWENPKFYEKIKKNAQHIRTLKFTGGEPTLIPQVSEVMDYMIDHGYAQMQEIMITTNGTHTGMDIYEKMLKFRKARINLSVDGTGAFYNYIRYPHTWDRWTRNTKNVLFYKDKLQINYQFTASVFNLFNIREMEKWFIEEGGYPETNFFINYLFYPKRQNIQYLPDDTLQRAVDYLAGGDTLSKNITRFITNTPNISLRNKQRAHKELKYDTLQKDRLRPARPNYDTIDNNLIRLRDLFI